MTRPNVQNLYPNVYLDIVKTLNLSDRITEYENELNKKIDRFLAADLSTTRERKETKRIFDSFYSAIMSAQNRSWAKHRAKVAKVLPRDPYKYLQLTKALSRNGFYRFCDHYEIGRWVDRYTNIRTIAEYLIELDRVHRGSRRYFRDIYRTNGLQGLLNSVIKDKRLPGIGNATARNSLRDVFGLDLVKPDAVLQRVFHNFGWVGEKETNPDVYQRICEDIGIHRAGVVDHVFWIFGNANARPKWNIHKQYCSGTMEKSYTDCKQAEPCFCKSHCQSIKALYLSPKV